MNDLTQYLKSRRSSLSMTLEEPGPSDSQIREMVQIAARVPDHGKLAPWRFVLWPAETRSQMHGKLIDLLEASDHLDDKPKKAQGTDKLLHAPCVIAVVSQATEHPKIPKWEQILSAGAACMNLLAAANGQGYEAQWLTAWYVYEDGAKDILGISDGEQVAGIVHIGSSNIPKNERPRPELDDIFSVRHEA